MTLPDLREDDEPPCYECGGWHKAQRCYECKGIVCSTCNCEADDDEDDYAFCRLCDGAPVVENGLCAPCSAALNDNPEWP